MQADSRGDEAQVSGHGRGVTPVSFGGLWENHSTMLGMSGSKGPGEEKLRTPARTPPRFSKSCVIPPGARTKDPHGHSNHSSPTRILITPSMT